MKQNLPLLFVLSMGAVLIGCGPEDIRVYDAPKEVRAAKLQLPEGWEELPAGQMAIASYVVRGAAGAEAKVSVSVLPASDELANVNRWRRQVGLEPTTTDELAKQREAVKVAGHNAALFDLAGTVPDTQKKARTLAVIANFGADMWFFKMNGDDELVAAQKPAFVNFLARFPLPKHDHAAEQGNVPPPVAPAAEAKPASLTKAPAGWVEQPPGAMQDAKFSVADGQATVTLSVFGNAAGGLTANINRWRGQVGLPPVVDGEVEKLATPLDLAGAKATIIDMIGSKQRLVVIIAPRGESTAFFKLLGEPSAVAAEKNSFIEFAKGTK